MKTYYHVVAVGEFGISAHQLRFSTLTSLYQFFHGYLKCRDYVLHPRVYVTRYWQLGSCYYSAGSVDFFFEAPKDYRNNRWIRNKLRFAFDGNWIFERRINSFVSYHDKLSVISLHDSCKYKVEVHDNLDLPF